MPVTKRTRKVRRRNRWGWDDPPEPPPPPYSGPFVVIRPVGLEYRVEVEPPLPTGDGEPRAFATKHDAFGAARELWTEHRLPVRDETIPETARAANREE